MHRSNVRCSHWGRVGEERTELCVLTLYLVCKCKIISKLKFYFKNRYAVHTKELRNVDPGCILVSTAPHSHPASLGPKGTHLRSALPKGVRGIAGRQGGWGGGDRVHSRHLRTECAFKSKLWLYRSQGAFAENHSLIWIYILLIKEVKALLIIELNIFRQYQWMPGKNVNGISWKKIHLQIKRQVLSVTRKINYRKFIKKGWQKCPQIEAFSSLFDSTLGLLHFPLLNIQTSTLTFDSLSIWPKHKGKIRKWSSISIKMRREK